MVSPINSPEVINQDINMDGNSSQDDGASSVISFGQTVGDPLVSGDLPSSLVEHQKLVKSLEEAIVRTKGAITVALSEYQQLIIKVAPTSEFEENERLRAVLKCNLTELTEQYDLFTNGKEQKKSTKEALVVPRNLPALQLLGDIDGIRQKTYFETIDCFVDMFEMVLYQHRLDVDQSWEACLISSVQHSMDKSSWFQESLMGKNLDWRQAKEEIKVKYGGDHTQSHYLEQLNNMMASKWEDPVEFISKFSSIMRRAVTAPTHIVIPCLHYSIDVIVKSIHGSSLMLFSHTNRKHIQ
ncbi:hypothetical protein BCR42DRAFT_398731 [Absidia repens]|uniref:Retrotransposon gag domain-containing protein n=1 Tax=Absidia repens TaxID=90262 RepID=A0A1X2HWZ4_9FUNG|nr:hypothetical protein BCR42DRAFT_398731 [Absidia repens]